MGIYYPESKVEVRGFIARHYDMLMNTISLGRYHSMIQRAIQLMDIKATDKILDLGTGTGRNVCLMMKYISIGGELIGLDISKEMISQFRSNCADYPNARIIDLRIDKPLPYEDEFDKAFISFVLHGFPQKARDQIITNVFRALKKNGEFFILDYNEFPLGEMPFYLRVPFKLMECAYAFDFIEKDWQQILAGAGFNRFDKHLFFGNYIRLLRGIKAQ